MKVLQFKVRRHGRQAHRMHAPLELHPSMIRLDEHHHVRSEWHRRGSQSPYRRRVDVWGPLLLLGLLLMLVGFWSLIAYAAYLFIRALSGGA